MTIIEKSSATISTYNIIIEMKTYLQELPSFRFLYTINYNMFNNIGEINGNISKATI